MRLGHFLKTGLVLLVKDSLLHRADFDRFVEKGGTAYEGPHGDGVGPKQVAGPGEGESTPTHYYRELTFLIIIQMS